MFQRHESTMLDRVFVALVPLALLVVTGCPSLSTMQTPATVPKGALRVGMGLESLGFTQKDSEGISTNTFGQYELNARYGVTDNVDLGVKLYGIGIEVGGKYQFVKGDFEAAIAPAVSYVSLDLSIDGPKTTTGITYLHLPLLFGYKLVDSLELAFGPKAVYMIVVDSTIGSSNQSSVTSTGFAAGGFASIQLRIGKAFWIAPEINVYKPFDAGSGGVIWQGGLVVLVGGAAPAAIGPPP